MSDVDCVTHDGHTRTIKKDRLILRPAPHALIMHESKLLLLRRHHTGKYHLHGGGVEIGGYMEETLKREVQEETGIEIEVTQFAHFEYAFFYEDPSYNL